MRKAGINAFQLKLAMAALMLLDHIYFFFPGTPDWFTWLGRLVMPVFAFLCAQSMVYTSDRGRYIRRLLTAALVMAGGNILLLLLTGLYIPMNIFLSLGISAALVYYTEMIRVCGFRLQYAGMAVFLLLISVFCEGGPLVPVVVLIFYHFRGNRLLMCAAYVVACAVLVPLLFGERLPQLLMVLGILPILLYNGEKGTEDPVTKRFFYVFYPAHIWGLFLVRILFVNQG